METLNWGIAGLGTIAHEFAEHFAGSRSCLYAASSRSLDKAKQFCQQYDIPKAFGSYEDLLNDDKVDVVYIATPHNFHFEQIKQALQYHKHVFCEKAITLNEDELKEVTALAQQNDLILAEGTTIFYMPLYQQLKEAQRRHEFGDLKMVQATFGSFKDPDPTNRFFNPDLAGGALLDIGPYAFGICHLFFEGRVTTIHSSMVPYSTGVDESSATTLLTDKNELATISMTFRAKMPKQTVVAFEKGYLTLVDYPRATKATFTTPTGEVTVFEAGDSEKTFEYEIQKMEKMILDHEPNDVLQLSNDIMTTMSACQKLWQAQ